jgi:hypothetical protein
MSKQTMSRAGRQSHAAHPQTNLILQYDDWQVKKTFLELFLPASAPYNIINTERVLPTDGCPSNLTVKNNR